MNMQGFNLMLKAMGIDPAKLEEQAKALLGDFIRQLQMKVDGVAYDLRNDMKLLEARIEQLEQKLGVAVIQLEQSHIDNAEPAVEGHAVIESPAEEQHPI
jgi:hypothetical protein